MQVRLCYTVNNPYCVKYDIAFSNIEHFNRYFFNKFCSSTVEYLNTLTSADFYRDFYHYRLNFHLPRIGMESFEKQLPTANKLKNYLIYEGISFSIHSSYCYNYYTYSNLQSIIEYFKKQLMCANLLHINNFFICNHLRYRTQSEGLECLLQLFYHVPNLQEVFCLENCDRSADILKCLDMCELLKLPCIFDNFHNKLNGNHSLEKLASRITNTWERRNYKPIVHYSNGYKTGKHGTTIYPVDLLNLVTPFKYYTDELTVIVELQNAKNAITTFKNETSSILNWNQFYVFYI